MPHSSLLLALFLGLVVAGTETVGKEVVLQNEVMMTLQTDPVGQFQVYYPSPSTDNCCATSEPAAVVLLCVGAGMSVGNYSDLARDIVIAGGEQSLAYPMPVAVTIIDPNPGRIVKQDGERYVNVANAVVGDIMNILPEYSSCCPDNRKEFIYFIGGHSAGGEGPLRALMDGGLTFSVAGYVGLDPYRISPDTMAIVIPSFLWGFSEMSCAVDPQYAAKAAYEVSSAAIGRIFYQVQPYDGKSWPPLLGGPHCSFTNAGEGCLGLYSGGVRYDWIREEVGRTVNVFFSTVLSGKQFSRREFGIDRDDVIVYVNADPVTISTAPNGKKSSKSERYKSKNGSNGKQDSGKRRYIWIEMQRKKGGMPRSKVRSSLLEDQVVHSQDVTIVSRLSINVHGVIISGIRSRSYQQFPPQVRHEMVCPLSLRYNCYSLQMICYRMLRLLIRV